MKRRGTDPGPIAPRAVDTEHAVPRFIERWHRWMDRDEALAAIVTGMHLAQLVEDIPRERQAIYHLPNGEIAVVDRDGVIRTFLWPDGKRPARRSYDNKRRTR